MSASLYALVVLHGTTIGRKYSLPQGPTVVGKGASCDLRLEDEAVSRKHCRFVLTGEVLTVEDLGSTNGTEVDGERIDGARTLEFGDQVRLATSVVKVVDDAPTEIVRAMPSAAPTIDPMTGLQNRRVFSTEVERHFAARTEFSLVMVDIDHLQRLNHNAGHHVGDEAIKHVAGVLDGLVPKDQLVARYAGQRFAVLLPGLSLELALGFGRQVCELISSQPFVHDRGSFSLSVSAGVSSSSAGSLQALVSAVDQALARAKAAGGSQASC